MSLSRTPSLRIISLSGCVNKFSWGQGLLCLTISWKWSARQKFPVALPSPPRWSKVHFKQLSWVQAVLRRDSFPDNITNDRLRIWLMPPRTYSRIWLSTTAPGSSALLEKLWEQIDIFTQIMAGRENYFWINYTVYFVDDTVSWKDSFGSDLLSPQLGICCCPAETQQLHSDSRSKRWQWTNNGQAGKTSSSSDSYFGCQWQLPWSERWNGNYYFYDQCIYLFIFQFYLNILSLKFVLHWNKHPVFMFCSMKG